MAVELDLTQASTVERILALQRNAYADEAELIGYDGIPPLHETRAELEQSRLRWAGIEDGGVVVAAVAWSESASGVDIDRLVVDRAHRRRGYGRSLVADLLASGRPVSVSTGTDNTPAVTLYEQLGFVASERRPIADGVTVTQFQREAPYPCDRVVRDRIAANLRAFERRVASASRTAAVAIVLAPVDGTVHYAFTRRSLSLRRSAGQYALPGGGADPGEDAATTARRELHEELGLDLGPDQVVGVLDDFVTRTDHAVTPVVLWSDVELALRPDPVEVDAAWFVPLAELDRFDAPRSVEHPDGGPAILRMPVRGEWVNPPTAAFLLQFRDVGLHGRHTRVHEVGQPTWTAR